MGWWIFFGILLALALIPLGIRVRYDSGGFVARVIVGPVRVTVFPMKKRRNRKRQPLPMPGRPSPRRKPSRRPRLSPAAAWKDFCHGSGWDWISWGFSGEKFGWTICICM